METCIDDVLRAPVPTVTATEEAGPSNTFAAAAASAATEDPLSLAGEAIENLAQNGKSLTMEIMQEIRNYSKCDDIFTHCSVHSNNHSTYIKSDINTAHR